MVCITSRNTNTSCVHKLEFELSIEIPDMSITYLVLTSFKDSAKISEYKQDFLVQICYKLCMSGARYV